MKKKYMTKAQAWAIYKAENKTFIEVNQNDPVLLCYDWNVFTDVLVKDGYISQSQFARWSNPFDRSVKK